MLKIYKLIYNNERKRIFPINDLSKDTQQYISTYKLHYKPYPYKNIDENQYKRQIELCNKLSKK